MYISSLGILGKQVVIAAVNNAAYASEKPWENCGETFWHVANPWKMLHGHINDTNAKADAEDGRGASNYECIYIYIYI